MISRHYLRTDTRAEMAAALLAAGIAVEQDGDVVFTSHGPGFDLVDLNAEGLQQAEGYYVNLLLRHPAVLPEVLLPIEVWPAPNTPWCCYK